LLHARLLSIYCIQTFTIIRLHQQGIWLPQNKRPRGRTPDHFSANRTVNI
jgi:hypothetical protein